MPYTEADIWSALITAAAKKDIHTVVFYASTLRDIHNEQDNTEGKKVLKW